MYIASVFFNVNMGTLFIVRRCIIEAFSIIYSNMSFKNTTIDLSIFVNIYLDTNHMIYLPVKIISYNIWIWKQTIIYFIRILILFFCTVEYTPLE